MNSLKINLLTALFASLVLVVGAQAQKTPGGGQGQTSSPNGNSGTNANSNNNRPDMDNLIHQGRAGSYYGGTVKLSGGALPWDPILINVVCNGDTRHTTVTDAKGNFTIIGVTAGTYEIRPTRPGFTARSAPAGRRRAAQPASSAALAFLEPWAASDAARHR